MKRKSLKAAGLVFGIGTVMAAGAAAEGIPYERVADMLFQVMSADREVYTRMVVQRLAVDEEVITASEHFEDDAALPLPAQMFRFGAEEVMDNTEDFSYSLLSLNPINKKNGPGTDLEKEGLQYVVDNRERTSTGRRSWAASGISLRCTPTTRSSKPAWPATTTTRTPRARTWRWVTSWAAWSFASRWNDGGRYSEWPDSRLTRPRSPPRRPARSRRRPTRTQRAL